MSALGALIIDIGAKQRRGALLQLLQPQVAAIVIVGDVPSTQCDWLLVQGYQLDLAWPKISALGGVNRIHPRET